MIEYSEALRRNKMRFFHKQRFRHTHSINAHDKNFNLPFLFKRRDSRGGVRKPTFSFENTRRKNVL